MRINHNISAQMANVNLKRTDSRLSSSLERLSSGYKINKAADDSAGMAITNKMRAQIRALDQASRNSQDGQSIIETAEGAMGEIETILQRVRELAVQTANDTYALEDREAVQKEVDELLDEVDRIATTTEFNGTALLDGSAARTFGSSNIDIKPVYTSMSVEKGDYKLTVDQVAEPAELTVPLPSVPGSIELNKTLIEFPATMNDDAVAEKLQAACDAMNIDMERTGGSVTFKTRATGSLEKITYSDGTGEKVANGKEAKITFQDGFSSTATYCSDGNLVTIRDNEGLNFPEVSCLNLGLRSSDGNDKINLCTQYSSENALNSMDRAIKKVSGARSTLGSYQNRLETTTSSLDLSSQNITEAMSRISDTDMADEMTKYTQYEVLSQAATSMLAQANNRPQQIMSLLQ